jgi:mRNA (guanine-N7-)-methyltransferase
MSVSSVAQHYNSLNPSDLATRSDSKIYYLRNFNNWIKSVLINEFIKRIKANNVENISVLDLGSGKGGQFFFRLIFTIY